MTDEALSDNLIARAMIAVASADERLVAEETAVISRIHEKLTGKEVSAFEVAKAMEASSAKPKDFANELARIEGQLDRATKETLLRAAYLVLLADKRIAARERKQLHDYAKALRIPEIHLTAILEDLSQLSN